MFQISKEESDNILMSKILTSSWGGTRKLPCAFTEQGVYMLMTVEDNVSYHLFFDEMLNS